MSSPPEQETVERCPTCGATVEVVTADEGTSHYRPAKDELQAERDRLRLALADRRVEQDRAAEILERGLAGKVGAVSFRRILAEARAALHPSQPEDQG